MEKIERGAGTLTKGNARALSFQTDVNTNWLLNNEVAAACIDSVGAPFTIDTYRKAKARGNVWKAEVPEEDLLIDFLRCDVYDMVELTLLSANKCGKIQEATAQIKTAIVKIATTLNLRYFPLDRGLFGPNRRQKLATLQEAEETLRNSTVALQEFDRRFRKLKKRFEKNR